MPRVLRLSARDLLEKATLAAKNSRKGEGGRAKEEKEEEEEKQEGKERG